MDNIREYEAMTKLNLTDAERALISDAADVFAGSFAALDAVDPGDAEPLFTVLDVKNALREDVSAKYFSREELLSGAPSRNDGFFSAPKTL